jgi:hypothetical protein
MVALLMALGLWLVGGYGVGQMHGDRGLEVVGMQTEGRPRRVRVDTATYGPPHALGKLQSQHTPQVAACVEGGRVAALT